MSAEPKPQHEHVWRMVLHLDGCHWYSSAFSCECGAAARAYDERDVGSDPYSAVWMEPVSEERCPRCEELLAGADAVHDFHIEERR